MTEEITSTAPAVDPAPAATETPAVETPAPRTYTQEEMDRITAKVKKNERQRTRKEVEAYYHGRDSVAPKPEPVKTQTDDAPSRNSFDTYEEYLEAKAAHIGQKVAKEELSRVESERNNRSVAEVQAKALADFQAKLRDKFPDIGERLESIGHIELPDGVAPAIAESEFGPEILNHFAGNIKDAERISSLSPSAALREIGRLEARFEAAKPAKATPDTPDQIKPAAPAPIKPGSGSGSSAPKRLSEIDNQAEFEKRRRAQIAARR